MFKFLNNYFHYFREKANMYKNVEKLSTELEDMKEKFEELRGAKQEAVRELLTLQEQHKAELRILNNSQLEEANARENLERKLCEIRSEVRVKWIMTKSYVNIDCNCFFVFSWNVCRLKMLPNGENENV